jgi:DNA-binding NarL/FixJ family response regulator
MTVSAIRLLLVDDHPVVLAGLEKLFELESDFHVVARCTSGEEALDAIPRYRPDVVVLDLHMPQMNGLAVLRELNRGLYVPKVVLLTISLNENQMVEAHRLGVRGMVLKEMAPKLLIDCIRKVDAGERWFEKTSLGMALDKLVGSPGAPAALTPRENDIVRMVARSLRNKEIAAALSITEGTVKIHLHNIYEKLGVDGRIALTLFAQKQGLV